jgi:hypothetical protein
MAKPGGGGRSQYVTPPVRTCRTVQKVNPKGVSQVGVAVDPKSVERLVSARVQNVTPYGPEVSLNSKSAPGQGRTIMRSGSQGTHGPVNQGSPRGPARGLDDRRPFPKDQL